MQALASAADQCVTPQTIGYLLSIKNPEQDGIFQNVNNMACASVAVVREGHASCPRALTSSNDQQSGDVAALSRTPSVGRGTEPGPHNGDVAVL
jgi:hypothetical protein